MNVPMRSHLLWVKNMNSNRLILAVLTAFISTFSSWLFADIPSGTTLYGIVPGSDIAAAMKKFGKPTKRLEFEDGWIAFAYKMKGHNLVLETAPDNPQRVIAVQITGDTNPSGSGLLGVNLGDSVDTAIKTLGPPIEKRASMDEKANQPIPNTFVYQYRSASFEGTNNKVASIKLHYEPNNGGPIAPLAVVNSEIRPVELLSYTYERWQSLVGSKYKCSDAKVISVQPNKTNVAGVISERWQTTVCGQQRMFVPILSPDGSGGYLVGFGE